jgi:ribosomal protein S18 acetylase RimI-like enzyme
MPDDITVRDVRPQDAADLQANCSPRNTLKEIRDHIAMHCAQDKGPSCYLVAEVAGMVVGQTIVQRKEHALEQHRASLYSLVVGVEYRRRGIARRLVDEACVRARAMCVEILEVGCRGGTPAEEVYHRLGFAVWGRLPGGLREPWGEQRVYDEVRFYMALKTDA